MQAENPGTRRVLDLIKKHRPSLIRVTLSDGEVKEVEVRGGRSRWTPAARTVAAYGWSRIELLGAKGAVLHVADNDAGDALGSEELPKPGTLEAREVHLMRIMNAHADLAVQRHIEALKPTLQAMQAQVNMLAEQLVAERKAAAATMESAADLAEQLARVAKGAKDDDGETDWTSVIQALPHIMRMFPSGPPPRVAPAKPKPNGAPRVPTKTSTEARTAPPADGATT